MIIFGLSGTNGAGKDTVGVLLAERYGFLFVSVSDLLRDEARKLGLTTDRKNLSAISSQWRRQHGHGVIVDKTVELFEQNKDKYKGLVTASLRHPGEVDRVHELGGEVIWVDADPEIRYGRISRRQRDDDRKSFEQFIAEQEAEMQYSGDAATLNMSEVKAKADIFLQNNGENIEAFKDYAEKSLGLNKHTH